MTRMKYFLILSLIVLTLMVGWLVVLNHVQTKDFERIPLHTPCSQLQQK